MSGVPVRERLEEWLGAMRDESDVVMRHPEMPCQQLVNDHPGTPMAKLARRRTGPCIPAAGDCGGR